ncbi:hypothetical protein HanIR_Chr02g0071391 [Helianthus annuus]|nr:hypothetical protein HanIR_Chr02g0071391 [Helianthus annuus]
MVSSHAVVLISGGCESQPVSQPRFRFVMLRSRVATGLVTCGFGLSCYGCESQPRGLESSRCGCESQPGDCESVAVVFKFRC